MREKRKGCCSWRGGGKIREQSASVLFIFMGDKY